MWPDASLRPANLGHLSRLAISEEEAISSNKRSAISDQLSAISYQRSAVSDQEQQAISEEAVSYQGRSGQQSAIS